MIGPKTGEAYTGSNIEVKFKRDSYTYVRNFQINTGQPSMSYKASATSVSLTEAERFTLVEAGWANTASELADLSNPTDPYQVFRFCTYYYYQSTNPNVGFSNDNYLCYSEQVGGVLEWDYSEEFQVYYNEEYVELIFDDDVLVGSTYSVNGSSFMFLRSATTGLPVILEIYPNDLQNFLSEPNC